MMMVMLHGQSRWTHPHSKITFSTLVIHVEENHGGLYKVSTKKERRKWKAKRRVRSDQVY